MNRNDNNQVKAATVFVTPIVLLALESRTFLAQSQPHLCELVPTPYPKVPPLARTLARMRSVLAGDARPVLVADATLVSASWKTAPNEQAGVEARFNRRRREPDAASALAPGEPVDEDDEEDETEAEEEPEEQKAPCTPESEEAELELERKNIFVSHEELNGAKWQLPAEGQKRKVTPTARLVASAPVSARGRMAKRRRRLSDDNDDENENENEKEKSENED